MHTGIRHPKSVMKNVIPVVMAGVIGIYGLIVGVILGQSIQTPQNSRENVYSIYSAMAHVSVSCVFASTPSTSLYIYIYIYTYSLSSHLFFSNISLRLACVVV